MCGIIGYISKNEVFSDVLTSMRDELVHRGPDGYGSYISDDKHVGFAHRRLSIIDLSKTGAQPMISSNEEYVITYNGEVYNHAEIRGELEAKGYRFRGTSDTEVVLNAYIEWKEKCLDKFNGMFAFAVYDKITDKIFLARDRFGIKPLYYAFLSNGDFAFASEIKALVKHPSFKKEVNFSSIKDYFKYRYIPSPKSIWKNVHKLEHSYYAYYNIKQSTFEKKQYYNLNNIILMKTSSLADVKKNLHTSIKLQLQADVETGAFLSGGMDSSSIVAIAQQYTTDIRTFSIGFEPQEFSELQYSKEVASYLGVKHISKIVTDIDNDIINQLAYYYDEPVADSSCVPTFILSKMTAEHLKVVLSGDGGDEVFSGYNWYDTYKRDYTKDIRSIINKIKRLFCKMPKNHIANFEEYYNRLLLNRFDNSVFKDMFCDDVYKKINQNEELLMEKYLKSNLNGVRGVQYVDLNTFMIDDILVKVDRATMAHSLESRVPLLDHNLVESVLCLPEEEFPSSSTGKPVLKYLVQDQLPSSVFNRQKKGFSAPVTSWDFCKKLLKGLPNCFWVEEGYINKQFILDLQVGKYRNGEAILWMILVLDRWAKKWLK